MLRANFFTRGVLASPLRSKLSFSPSFSNEVRNLRQTPMLMQRSFLATQPPGSNNDDGNDKIRKAVGVGGAVTLLMGKTKWVLAAAKLTKFSSVFSMLATTGTYAFFFGWPFAVGMVGQIALHESGHALAMHALNIPFGPAVFVPFMGAVIPMRGRPKDVREEAKVAIAGPVFGGLTALGISLAGVATDSQLLITLADFGFMINLFNMLPLGDLDGGRVSKAISKYLLLAGFGGGCFMAYEGMIRNPIFYLVLFSAAFTTWGRFFGSSSEPHPSYYRINPGERLSWTAGYFGLIAALLLAMQYNRQKMKSIGQLRQEQGRYGASSDYERQLEKFAVEWGEDDPFLGGNVSGQADGDFWKSHFDNDRQW